jgi:hypothetical protein
MACLLISLSACSDDDDSQGNSSSYLQIYGVKYTLSSGAIYESNPHTVAVTEDYVYEDKYEDEDSGQMVAEEVHGYKASDESTSVGNFILSLYETGLTVSESEATAKGKGACICFHLNSKDVNSLAEGRYELGSEYTPFTFAGYVSSEYDSQSTVTPAELSEGTVDVSKEGLNYRVSFKGVTTFGGVVEGEYVGPLTECRVSQISSLEYTDVQLAGLFNWVELYLYAPIYGITEKMLADEGYDVGDPDLGIGKAFYSLSSGMASYADAFKKQKEAVDLALYYDKDASAFTFKSPIEMRSYLGHSSKYTFPYHTVYMKAPSSFTDESFENLSASDFTVDITPETVSIPVSDADSFTPVYLFFKTGKGTQGVIKVKEYIPMEEKVYDLLGSMYGDSYAGLMLYYYTQNPILVMDIKCPAIVSDPKIR